MSLDSPDRLVFMVRFIAEPMVCDSLGTDMQEANSGYAGLGLRENASLSPLSPSFSLLFPLPSLSSLPLSTFVPTTPYISLRLAGANVLYYIRFGDLGLKPWSNSALALVLGHSNVNLKSKSLYHYETWMLVLTARAAKKII